MGDVVSGEPDLVDTVVERNDIIARHYAAYVGNHALGDHRKTFVVAGLGDVRSNLVMQGGIIAAVALQLAIQAVSQPLDRSGDVADDLELREVDLIDFSRLVIDMDDGLPARLHEEGRLLHHVVTDIDDQIGLLDRAVNIIARR